METDEYEVEDLKKMVEIALACTLPVSSRPTISEIAVMISGDRSAVVDQLHPRPLPSLGSFPDATISVSHFTGR